MEKLILETRLRPPHFERMFDRGRLVDSLTGQSGARLYCIKAEAGYGKTILMAQLLAVLPEPHVWYQLDDKDEDASVLLLHLVEGVRRQAKGNGSFCADIIQSVTDGEFDLAPAMDTFIHEFQHNVHAPFNFFLDDFHKISLSPASLVAVQRMIVEMPESVRFFIATRGRPRLALARLRASHSILEVGAEDLRFNADEIDEFFFGGKAAPAERDGFARVIAATEGWPAALALVRNQLDQRPAGGMAVFDAAVRRDIYEYLVEEVWVTLGDELQEVLENNSLLEVMEPDIFSEVSAGDNPPADAAASLLDAAVERCVFVTRVEPENAYRVHPLFREFLVRQLEVSIGKDAIRELHRRYAELFIARGRPEAAVYHLIEAGMSSELADTIEVVGQAVLESGRTRTMARWLENLPSGLIEPRPWLCYFKARVTGRGKDLDESARLLTIARKGFRDAGDKRGSYLATMALTDVLGIDDKFKEAIAMSLEAVEVAATPTEKISAINRMALYNMIIGRPQEAMNLWDEARGLCTATDDASRFQIDSSMVSAKYFIGDFGGILELTEALLGEFNPAIQALQRFIVLTYRAIALFETAQYEAAAELLARSGELLGEEYRSRERFIDILQARVMLYRRQGRKARKITRDIVGVSENLFLLGPEIPLVHIGNLDRHHRAYEKALAEHKDALALCDRGRLYTLASCLVNVGADKMRIDAGGEANGEVELAAAEALGVRSRANYILAQVAFHRAWRALKQGHKEKALRNISAALTVATQYGYDHFVYQEGRISLELLAFAFAHDVEREYLLEVFAMIGARALSPLAPLLQSADPQTRSATVRALARAGGLSAVPRIQRMLRDVDSRVRDTARKVLDVIRENSARPEQILTRREFEVLEMVAEGATNPEIAERLVITESTVKTHVSSIFRKLSVSTRVQAAMYYNQHLPDQDRPGAFG